MTTKDFPADLLALRERLDLTQEEITQKLGIAQYQIWARWETGAVEPREITKRFLNLLANMPKEEAKRTLKKMEKLAT